MEKSNPRLLLVDFDTGIAGVEDVVRNGLGQFLHLTHTEPKSWEFRRVRDTAAAIGPLAIIEAAVHHLIEKSSIGRVVEVKTRHDLARFLVRPCRAALMPQRLWEKSWGDKKNTVAFFEEYCRHSSKEIRFSEFRAAVSAAEKRKEEVQLFQLRQEIRRHCFAMKDELHPQRMYFAKGTCSVMVPKEAVACLGGGCFFTIVFLNRFAQPIEAWTGHHHGLDKWVQQIPIPEKLEWTTFAPLGKSGTDRLFGTAA